MSAIDDARPPLLKVGMLLLPRMTLLDLVGPQLTLVGSAEIYLLWENLEPVMSDSGIAVVPTMTLDDCPTDLDILFVPGGDGAFYATENDRVMAFLKKHGQTAKYITSVCTGSILLAAAGLLDGYKAATHWATFNILEELGVEGVRERVVIDRNRVTGGGVTAGIDFGLTLLALLRGDTAAKCSQLLMEYDPKPPFNCGTEKVAEPEILSIVNHFLERPNAGGLEAIKRFKERSLADA